MSLPPNFRTTEANTFIGEKLKTKNTPKVSIPTLIKFQGMNVHKGRSFATFAMQFQDPSRIRAFNNESFNDTFMRSLRSPQSRGIRMMSPNNKDLYSFGMFIP